MTLIRTTLATVAATLTLAAAPAAWAITAQQALLASERQDVQIRVQQWVLSVALIKALGGGWQPSDASSDSYNAQR